MDWATFWSIAGVIGTGVGLIYAFLRNFKTDINSHIDSVNTRLDKGDKEWKDEFRKMDQRVTETNKRMDGVYHLLLKKLDPNTP
jgi:hypothetical protein